MNITKQYTYQESYLPTKRHKIPCWRDVKDEITVTVPELTTKEAPVAFVVKDYKTTTEYRLWNDRLWVKTKWSRMVCGKSGLCPIAELIDRLKSYEGWYSEKKSKEQAVSEIVDYANKFIIIDNIVYNEIGEPRYVIMTFGLGHNHASTSLMLDNYYNSNIGKERYYNALEREKAIAEAKRIAERRGDTESIPHIGRFYHIEVLIPEAVKCNPQREQGDGDPFLNRVEELTEVAPDSMTAALLAMSEFLK